MHYHFHSFADEETTTLENLLNSNIVRSWNQYATIIIGGNGQGNEMNQLSNPTDIVLDKRNKSLIICDSGNSRIVRWPIEHFDNE